MRFEDATQIFIHTREKGYLFSVITAALEQLNLSVQDARIYSSVDGMTLDTFFVLDSDGASIADDLGRIKHIGVYLNRQLQNAESYPDIVQRRTPRQMKHFSIPTVTNMSYDPIKQVTVLEVATPDRPGLLARIGKIFFDFNIDLRGAKIATLGERVEDVFFITDSSGRPLEDEDLRQQIQRAICEQLDEQAAG